MTNKIAILIADDHELVRDAVAQLLRAEADFEISVANDMQSVQAAVVTHGSFDIVLMDVNMPGMNGLEGVETIVAANSPGAIVIFSGQVDNSFVMNAIDLGAKGYIPKTLPLRSLSSALRLVSSGQTFLPIMDRQDVRASQAGYNLTDRERSVLRKLPSGMTNKEIARIECITEMMVKMHMRSICAKLNAKNRTHAAMIARQMSLG